MCTRKNPRRLSLLPRRPVSASKNKNAKDAGIKAYALGDLTFDCPNSYLTAPGNISPPFPSPGIGTPLFAGGGLFVPEALVPRLAAVGGFATVNGLALGNAAGFTRFGFKNK